MRKDLILSGNFKFVGEFEFKTGKRALKFIDEETGKVIKCVVSANALSSYDGDFRLVNLKFYKDTFDILEVSADLIENF